MSLVVIGNCTIRQIIYEFLLAFCSNYGAVLYRLRHVGRKSQNCYIPSVFSAPCRNFAMCLILITLEWFCYRAVKKLRRCVKPIPECDGQRDRIPISILRVSILTRINTSSAVAEFLYQYYASVSLNILLSPPRSLKTCHNRIGRM